MTTLSDSIDRFIANEVRVNTFVNQPGEYLTSDNTPVETLPSFMARVSDDLDATLQRFALPTLKGAWAAGTSYSVWDAVSNGGTWYICITAHTSSSTFSADGAHWIIYQGLTSATLFDVAPGYFATAADLRATANPATLKSVITLGAVTAGDQGGGMWRWDAASTDADNLGTIICPTGRTSAGRWLRQYTGDINVRWFGAQGDFSQATQTGTDDTAAIQAAITFASTFFYTSSTTWCRPPSVYIPDGIYYLSSPLIVNHVQYLRIYGDRNTQLHCYSVTGYAVKLVNRCDYFMLERLRFTGYNEKLSSLTNTWRGILQVTADTSVVDVERPTDNIVVRHCEAVGSLAATPGAIDLGLWENNTCSIVCTIEQVVVKAFANGCAIRGGYGTMTIRNCHVHYCAAALDTLYQTWVTDCTFESIKCLGRCNDVTFSRCYIGNIGYPVGTIPFSDHFGNAIADALTVRNGPVVFTSCTMSIANLTSSFGVRSFLRAYPSVITQESNIPIVITGCVWDCSDNQTLFLAGQTITLDGNGKIVDEYVNCLKYLGIEFIANAPDDGVNTYNSVPQKEYRKFQFGRIRQRSASQTMVEIEITHGLFNWTYNAGAYMDKYRYLHPAIGYGYGADLSLYSGYRVGDHISMLVVSSLPWAPTKYLVTAEQRGLAITYTDRKFTLPADKFIIADIAVGDYVIIDNASLTASSIVGQVTEIDAVNHLITVFFGTNSYTGSGTVDFLQTVRLVPVAVNGYRTSAGAPSVPAWWVGQDLLDTSNGAWYRAKSLNTNGVIQYISTIVTGGSGYTDGETCSVTGVGAGAKCTVTVVDGAVTSVTIVAANRGTGYRIGEVVAITADDGSGTGATGIVTVLGGQGDWVLLG